MDEKRADYRMHVTPGNVWLLSQQKPRRVWSPPQVVTSLGCIDLMDRSASCIPRLQRPAESDLFTSQKEAAQLQPNLSRQATTYLTGRGDSQDLFYHIVATLHAPEYAAENAGALRQDWPRVPLPDHRETLLAGAELGQELARLLDPEQTAPGVSAGDIREELKVLGVVQRMGGGELDEADLALTAGWGHVGAGGAIMPGRGRVVEREYTADERATLAAGSLELGLSEGQALALLGETTVDVYLNDVAYWGNVPVRVWEYTLGGYPVVKKWLSYREEDGLGRALKLNEVRYVTSVVRRVAAILLLGPALDAHYAAAKERGVEP